MKIFYMNYDTCMQQKYFCLMSVVYLSLIAIEVKAETTLTWEQCVNEVTQQNPNIIAAQRNQQSTEFLSQGARSSYYPQLNANLGYNHGTSSTLSPDSASTTNNTYTANLSLSQNLFNGFGDEARVSQSESSVRNSAAVLQIAKAKASYTLKTNFQGLLYAQNSVKLSADIVQRRRENLRLVELRFESGRENRGSVLLSQAYLEQALLNELQAKNQLTLAQTQLAAVLGRDESTTSISITGEIPTQEPIPNLDLYQLVAQTPEHQQAVASENSAEAGVQLARSGFYPSVDLTGQYGKLGTEFFPNNDRWSVGVSVSIPIFSGGRDYYNNKSAISLYSAATLNRDSVDKQVLVNLRQNYHTFLEAVQRQKVDESFYKAAEVRAKIARAQYQNGLVSFADWDLIENDLITRETNRLQSQRDRINAEAAWEQVLGKGVIP